MRSSHFIHDRQPYTDYILLKCNERSDEWSEKVKLWMQEPRNDLHAVEGRYHAD